MSKIFRYIIISSIFVSGYLFNVAAQDNKPQKQAADTIKTPVFQGIFVEFDVAPLIESVLVNKYAYSFQGNMMLNLNNRFFPVIEIGFGGAEVSNQKEGRFRTSGLFEKIGMDYTLMKTKPGTDIKNNFLLVGIRLGMSHFNYSMNNMQIEDGYWGTSGVIDRNSVPNTRAWLEIVAGIRVPLYRNIYIGWNIRNKRLFNNAKEGELAPWYVPGYGIGKTSAWGFSYTLGYRF